MDRTIDKEKLFAGFSIEVTELKKTSLYVFEGQPTKEPLWKAIVTLNKEGAGANLKPLTAYLLGCMRSKTPIEDVFLFANKNSLAFKGVIERILHISGEHESLSVVLTVKEDKRLSKAGIFK